MASKHHDHIKGARWQAARAECFDRDGYQCTRCGSEDELQADHVVPLDLLFVHGVTPDAIEAALDVENLTTLCKPCNASKGARITTEPTRLPWVNPRWGVLAWLLDEDDRETETPGSLV